MFSSTFQYYASVDGGGLKVWDVASNTLKAEYKRHDHLVAEFTCIAWVQPQGGLGQIALGRKNGTITVWDLALKTMTIATASSAADQQSVNDIVFSPSGTTMYSVSSAAHVLQWTFDADGAGWSSRRCFAVGERGASQLCIDASGARIASAHSGIDLWDVASGAKVCSFTGHADVVRCLEFSLDGKFIVSGAEDRFLSVWAVSASVLSANANAGSLHSTDSKSKKKKKGGKKRKHAETVGAPLIKVAARTLVAQAQPLAVAMRSSGKSGAAGYRLLAVTADGNGLVWDLADVGAQKSGAERLPRPPSTADCRVSVAAPGRGALAKGHAAASAAIISAVFASANARTIVVAQGRAMDPSFATKSIVGEGAASSSVLSRVLIASVSAKGRNAAPAGSAAAKGISAANGKNLVGPMGAATRDVHLEQRAAKRLRVSGESKAASTGEFGSVRDYLQASASGSGSGAAAAAEEEEEEEGEQNDADVVLGDRVEALSQELSVDITQQREDEALALATPQSDALAPPPSLSMSAVLDQALQSGDNAMLEYCLAVQTQPIVESTVDRLSPQRAVQFIDRIVYKFERNPNRSLSLSVWIHAVLRRHAAYLMTVPDLVARLRPIYQLIEARLSHLDDFLRLAGRLDLILSQQVGSAEGDSSVQVERMRTFKA